MQILYLSNRPDILNETWQHVRHFLPWVTRAVVVAPASTHRSLSNPDFTLLEDREITGLTGNDLAELDHVRRNVVLRRAAIASGAVEETFVLSDDDYRPLRAIDRSFFTDGVQDTGYYFYDLAAWPGDETPFDEAQHVTSEALNYLGFPRLAYGSHMPQIMRRSFWTEAFDLLETVTDDSMICEWALYFNIAATLHPEHFTEPQPFHTLGWPQYGAEWPWWVNPSSYSFENFYPEMYEPGHLFAHLPSSLQLDSAQQDNFAKILEWTRFRRAAARLDFPAGTENPWTKSSALRRASFSVLRPARKALRYLNSEDRAQIAELAGAVSRLERPAARPQSRSVDSQPAHDSQPVHVSQPVHDSQPPQPENSQG